MSNTLPGYVRHVFSDEEKARVIEKYHKHLLEYRTLREEIAEGTYIREYREFFIFKKTSIKDAEIRIAYPSYPEYFYVRHWFESIRVDTTSFFESIAQIVALLELGNEVYLNPTQARALNKF